VIVKNTQQITFTVDFLDFSTNTDIDPSINSFKWQYMYQRGELTAEALVVHSLRKFQQPSPN